MDLHAIFLSHEGRLNRQAYFFYSVGIQVAVMIVSFMLGAALGETGVTLSIVLSLGSIYFYVILCIKRLHDIERPGVHYLLFFVPFYNLYLGWILVFKQGTNGSNEYGPDPLGAQ